LLLDEATSNVDPETEQSLGRALAVLSQGRTTVSVAHRLSTAEAADLVVVVEDGQVVQFGPHHELVAVPGIYRQLYESWVGNTHQAVS
jgi:ABC-type multidrug transport system fused ATPase/permease subunit